MQQANVTTNEPDPLHRRDDPIVRRASAGDAESLARLHHETVVHAYRHIFGSESPPPSADALTDGWQALLATTGCCVYIARDMGSIVGSVAVVPDRTAPSGLLLKRLHVHPNQWGRSLGSALHDHALADATERGADRVNLWVLEANARARGMYERRGWVLQPGQTLPNSQPQILDVLYELDLAARTSIPATTSVSLRSTE